MEEPEEQRIPAAAAAGEAAAGPDRSDSGRRETERGAGGDLGPPKPIKPSEPPLAAGAVAPSATAGPVVLQPGQVIQGYEIMKSLGKGKFSIVYMAKRHSDKLLCALKKINIFDMMVPKQRDKCLKEVRLLQSLDHPNIVKFLDSFIDQNELLIIVEWAEKGDLKRLIRKAVANETSLTEDEIWMYSRQLAGALDHMHSKRIMHRDIKPANIFIKKDGSLQLGDLGLGRFFSSHTLEAFSKVGTPLYMSPEVLHGAGYDMRSDVWSLGCVFYELVMLRAPFKSDQQLSLYDLFVRISKGQYPPLPETVDAGFRELAAQMLALDPAQRLDCWKVLEICNRQAASKKQAAAQLPGAGQAGGLEKSSVRPSPLLVMDDIIEKLKLLECDERLLRPAGFPMLNRCFFIQPMRLPGKSITQFRVMHCLLRWLLGMLQSRDERLKKMQVPPPQSQAADASAGPCVPLPAPDLGPGAVGAGDAAAGGSSSGQIVSGLADDRSPQELVQELVADLQLRGVQVSGGTMLAQLKQGFGEEVCYIINELINAELVAQDFHFELPSWAFAADSAAPAGKSPGGRCPEICTDTESVDEHLEGSLSSSSDDQGSADADGWAAEGASSAAGLEPVQLAQDIDPEVWAAEVARATEALRGLSASAEACDWRVALKSVRDLRHDVKAALAGRLAPPEGLQHRCCEGVETARDEWLMSAAQSCCCRWREELTRLREHEARLATFVERLPGRAAMQNCGLETSGALAELRQLRAQIATETDAVGGLRESVENQSAELSTLETKLEKVQSEAQEKQEALHPGSGPTADDSGGKLQQLRKNFKILREENCQLEVRLRCLQRELFQRRQQVHQPAGPAWDQDQPA
eukprot:TRINITY_DN19973_c0_g2_i2.p1 TRINITY_DN19973_c0_g2~~TRINITY_DN19973_c0_g2_i2.p1  ORF type:complete len:863 (+),score=214.30 TRINITY_DN19973_c0_g2_i2:123-2711(+)